MPFRDTIGKPLIRKFLSTAFASNSNIPILRGPLKRKWLPKRVALENLSMVFSRYESNVIRTLFNISKPIKVAYDIGAHVGYMTLALATHLGSDAKVFAFEPAPENMAVIQQLIIQNSLQRKVSLIPIALADELGEQSLINCKSSSMYFLETALDGQNVSGCSSLTVPTCTLDSFVFEKLNPPPDLIKIDVEGAEALVIQGGLRTLQVYSPKIIIEIHGPKNALKALELLQNLNYSWSHLTKNGRERVTSEHRLLSHFSKDSWTHHFLLVK